MNTCRLVARLTLLCLALVLGARAAVAQGFTRRTWHDAERKHVKEFYQVKDTISNIAHGKYISYYLNGNIESKGQFTNNETTGIWEFYYETGNLKMRGILRQNANYGKWEYYYESGEKSMEGTLNGRKREGEWKTYYENGQLHEAGAYHDDKRVGFWKAWFEDGARRGEIDYDNDFGTYTEYYHSGKIAGVGPKAGARRVGHWRMYAEDGTLAAEGDYLNGKKHGVWTTYFPSGNVASKGQYVNDEPDGKWEYRFEDGKVSSSGEYLDGVRTGSWQTLNADGSLKSEAHYVDGAGEYREYYPGGELKVKGRIVDGKREGAWEYFYEDGRPEGRCEFKDDKGTYYGYYPNGNLRTKGTLEGEQKTGTWELYENDGELSGYYRPFYDDRQLSNEIMALARASRKPRSQGRKFTHFDARFNEFRGLIVAGNPVMMFAGRFPLGVEFYLQERLGHEFEFIGMRDPFFRADVNVPIGKVYDRGYSITVKQKLYNEMRAGMWYFGHEIRFTNVGHFANITFNQVPENFFTATAVEQRIEWGVLLGYRIMRHNNAQGFTIDAFASANAGYRGFDADPNYATWFADLNQSRLSTSFHFGLNFGKVFSFR